MRYGADHKRETRRKLLEAAADAIRIEGPHQLGVASVMAKTGLTHGGFYAHFASKDELVAEAVAEMFRQRSARLLREVEQGGSAEGLWSWIRFYLSPAHRDAPGSGCPLPALLSDVPRMPLAAREAFSNGVHELKKKLAELLGALGHAPAEAAADSLLAELVGAMMLARVEPDRQRSDEILVRSRAAIERRFRRDAAQ